MSKFGTESDSKPGVSMSGVSRAGWLRGAEGLDGRSISGTASGIKRSGTSGSICCAEDVERAAELSTAAVRLSLDAGVNVGVDVGIMFLVVVGGAATDGVADFDVVADVVFSWLPLKNIVEDVPVDFDGLDNVDDATGAVSPEKLTGSVVAALLA